MSERFHRHTATALFAVALLAAPASAQELGRHLKASGHTRTIWVDFNDIRIHRTGRLDPAVTWQGAPDCWTTACTTLYEARYGAGSWRKKGNLVGERYSFDALAAYFRLVGLPSLPTRLDREDAVLAAFGSAAWWDAVLLPAVRVPEPVVTPPVVVVPPAVTPPAVVPPGTPVVIPVGPGAPVGNAALSAVIAKLEEALAALKNLLPPSQPSTGNVKLRVVP